MKATYRGDCRADVLGQVMGPDTAGGHVQAIAAVFDGERTTVTFRPITAAEALRMTRRGQLWYLPLPACCDVHVPGGELSPAPWLGEGRVIASCCDPDDCSPCCPRCPTCPTHDASAVPA